MKIAHITLPNNLILAPMAGFTDVCVRRLFAENGAGLTITEMVSVKALLYGSQKTLELLKTSEAEKIKCVQLFGAEPDDFYRCAGLPALKNFDIIDVNMGCPAPKICREASGSALMGDHVRAADIVRALKEAGKTVTVKTRLGLKRPDEIFRFAAAVAQAGAQMITVHGRTREQMFSGQADFSFVKTLRAQIDIPITVSGGVIDRQSYLAAAETGADGIMIGRGALSDPAIFLKLGGQDSYGGGCVLGGQSNCGMDYSLGGQGGSSEDCKQGLILKLIDYMAAEYGPRDSAVYLRKFLPYMLRGVKGGKELRGRMNFCNDIAELRREFLELDI